MPMTSLRCGDDDNGSGSRAPRPSVARRGGFGLWQRNAPDHARAAMSLGTAFGRAGDRRRLPTAAMCRFISPASEQCRRRTLSIHSQVDGKLQEVLFTEGQHVKKGDVLARVDPRLFQAALDQAKAKKAQNVALLSGAEKISTRFKTWRTRISPRNRMSITSKPRSISSRPRSRQTGEIETAQTQIDYTTITAPSDGRMGVRLVDPGNIVHASDPEPIATLVLTQPSAVHFTLPARALSEIRNAMARAPSR